MAGSIGDLGTQTVQSGNQNQFLGQTATSNPLLELAQGIMGNAATAQGRGDMAFGGGAGVPTISSYSDPSGGQHTQVLRRGFTTPGTTHGVTPTTSSATTPIAHTPVVQAPGQPAPVPHPVVTTPTPAVVAPTPVTTPVSPGMGAPGPGGGAW